MHIYREDVEEVGAWIVFIMFLFAVSYIAEGGSSILVLWFAITFGTVAIIGILKSFSEFLEKHYSEKRDVRKQ